MIVTAPYHDALPSERRVIRADDYPSCTLPGPCAYCGRECRIRYFRCPTGGALIKMELMCSECLHVGGDRRREIRTERYRREAANLYLVGKRLPEIAELMGLSVETLRKHLAAEIRTRDYAEVLQAEALCLVGWTQAEAARAAGISTAKLKRRRESLRPAGEQVAGSITVRLFPPGREVPAPIIKLEKAA